MILKFSQKAFSLVEIMVAISIVAVVTAVAASSISSIQKTGRDAQRQSDLRTIQSVLQQYYADQNFYPDDLGTLLTSGLAITNCTGRVDACTVSKTYLSRTPTDPKSGTATPYCYRSELSASNSNNCGGVSTKQCQYYNLCATLESPSGVSSCNCGAGAANFKITPL